MMQVRRSDERGHARHGWLDSHHTFSFADYYDPEHMGFRALRVINEDRVVPGEGFPTHPHRDMEIISYVVGGALAHRDSMGNGSVIRPGEVQRMSAGTGVAHSEHNASEDEPVHFLQIWIVPERRGLPPSYEQKDFSAARRGKLALVASRDGRDGSVTVHQDVSLYAAELERGASVTASLAPGRHAWIQIVRGTVRVNDVELRAGDGAELVDETKIEIHAGDSTELLLFDLA
jgi:redox-sensitive bicupin YhaK (pirin superfamily)